ncbi:MAG: GDSL-type esterase/lipase family protein [Lachnotalea sp.]
MFYKSFHFASSQDTNSTLVTSDSLYSFDKGYGFLTEQNCSEHELLQIPELNNGFELWYWYIGCKLIQINQDKTGCFIDNSEKLPLSFKANVPHSGNYKITLSITAEEKPLNNLIIFTGRRRLALRDKNIAVGETYTFDTIVNVCDYIPRGKEIAFTDNSVCITILGETPKISAITIEEINIPTIYIAGDSTLTDQTGAYPYVAESCYCGWAQFLGYFLNNKASICNHAHSGLTTESFREGGHYSIIEENIKPDDYFLLQFGHNDQKLKHLTFDGGYKENVIAYIDEMRAKKAIPVLVSPLCRNSWKGTDGTYNDLLADYAMVIAEIGKEKNVPVIDLHKSSYDFITLIGLEDAKSYFYPGDYTHTNDFGAYKMASFVADGFHTIDILKDYPLANVPEWTPPKRIELQKPPVGFENIKPPVIASFQVGFRDIDSCDNKDKVIELASIGVISNTEPLFRPNDLITRVEALVMIIKISNFFPTNVYNDMFQDVVGHEWYAGTVECSWTNGIIDKTLVDNNFYPNKAVTYEELISFEINGYKGRKLLPEIAEYTKMNCFEWANSYYMAAKSLGILDTTLQHDHLLTKQEAVNIIYTFKSIM